MLLNKYVWVIILKKKQWVGYMAGVGEKINVCRVLVGRPEGKSPPGKPRCRWEILKRLLKKCNEMFWNRLICLRAGTRRGLCVVDDARAFDFLKIPGIT